MQETLFPAADVATDLQRAFNKYLQEFDNPLVKVTADKLSTLNRKAQLVAQAKVLNNRMQFIKFSLSTVARKIPLVRKEEQPTAEHVAKLDLLAQLWDQVDQFRMATTEQLNSVQENILERYIADITQSMDAVAKHVKIPPGVLRRLGNLLPTPEVVPTFTVNDCLRIVRAIVQDELDMLMRWKPLDRTGECNLEKIMVELFPDWDGRNDERAAGMPTEHYAVWKEQAEKCSSHLFRIVIEPVILEVTRWVHSVVKGRTWTVWYVKPWAHDLALEKGQDYRIADWERRMASGEWEIEGQLGSELLNAELIEIEACSDDDIDATLARFERETAAGFEPRMFHSRLVERPTENLFQVGAPAVEAVVVIPARKRRG